MLKEKIEGVIHGKDLTLFHRGYECENAGLKGDWSGEGPPPPPDNADPAFLLGRTTFWCDWLAKQGSPQVRQLLDLPIP